MKKMNEQKLDKMLSFIKDYIARNNGRSPKFSEILEYMEMTNSVGYRYLTTLAERGEIVYNGRDTLSIAGQDKMRMSFRRVPILGGIPCGLPEEHSELIEGYLALPEEWLGGDCSLLRGGPDGYR